MTKKKWIVAISVSVGVFFVLAVFAAIFDLKISCLIADMEFGEYYSSNLFGRYFEIVGEMPLYGFISFALAVVFFNLFALKNNILKFFLCSGVLIVICLINFYAIDKLVGYLYKLNNKVEKFVLNDLLRKIIIAVFISLAYIFFVRIFSPVFIEKLLPFAVAVLLTAALSQLIAQGLKIINFRVRYRALLATMDFNYSHFTPFYKWNGIYNGTEYIRDAVKSFPSGHTTAAAITYTLMLLPFYFRQSFAKVGKYITFAVALLYTGTVAVARIIMGAHYFSDVLFGGSITFACVFLSYWFLEKNKFKKLAFLKSKE